MSAGLKKGSRQPVIILRVLSIRPAEKIVIAKVSSKTHTKQQLNDYANQHNPNSKACKANKAKMRSKKRKERVDNVADLEWFCYGWCDD